MRLPPAGASVPPEPDSARVANAPCSWGVIGGLGPATPYGAMLDELVAAGYRGTELGDYGFMPTDPSELADELARRQLTLLGGFVGVPLADPDAVAQHAAEVLQVARLLAAAEPGPRRPLLILADADGRNRERFANAGRITPAMALPPADFARFTANATRLAERVAAETGLTTAFHPHGAGWIETPAEVEAFLDATDPERIGLVFDSAHLVYGSGEPDPGDTAATLLARFLPRVATIHLKDCHAGIAAEARREGWDYSQAVRAGLYCELGQGSIDFGKLIGVARAGGYRDWFTVEQDVFPAMGTPFASAERNRAFLRGLGL